MSAPVDVLAVLDAMTLSAERLAAGEAVTSCAATVEVAKCTRAAVAELIEAIEATRATRGGIMALATSDARVTRLWTALARVKGGAA